jgi:hypothetical protein
VWRDREVNLDAYTIAGGFGLHYVLLRDVNQCPICTRPRPVDARTGHFSGGSESAAVERYGSPERLVTDGGGIFKATQSEAVYRALGIVKELVERGKPYQSYIETTFNIQRRMADHHFATAESW